MNLELFFFVPVGIGIFVAIESFDIEHLTILCKSQLWRNFSSIWITKWTENSCNPSMLDSERTPHPDVGKFIATVDV